MNNFTTRKLNVHYSFGEKLKKAREFQQLSIEDVSKILNIKTKHLLALEEERIDDLPSGLYGKSYLKKYANYLKLNTEELVSNWNKINIQEKTSNPFSKKIIQKHKFIVFPKIIKNILLSLAVLICFLYLVFYFKKIILPPKLEIIEPKQNLLINKHNITIIGQTDEEAEVKINGKKVLNTHKGEFKQDINLKDGLNNIKIEAKKKYSKNKTIMRQVLVKE